MELDSSNITLTTVWDVEVKYNYKTIMMMTKKLHIFKPSCSLDISGTEK